MDRYDEGEMQDMAYDSGYEQGYIDGLLEAQRLGHSGVAQSSWGPTGCIFVENEAKAKQLIEHLTQFAKTTFSDGNAPIFIQTSADNHGAVIESSM